MPPINPDDDWVTSDGSSPGGNSSGYDDGKIHLEDIPAPGQDDGKIHLGDIPAPGQDNTQITMTPSGSDPPPGTWNKDGEITTPDGEQYDIWVGNDPSAPPPTTDYPHGIDITPKDQGDWDTPTVEPPPEDVPGQDAMEDTDGDFSPEEMEGPPVEPCPKPTPKPESSGWWDFGVGLLQGAAIAAVAAVAVGFVIGIVGTAIATPVLFALALYGAFELGREVGDLIFNEGKDKAKRWGRLIGGILVAPFGKALANAGIAIGQGVRRAVASAAEAAAGLFPKPRPKPNPPANEPIPPPKEEPPPPKEEPPPPKKPKVGFPDELADHIKYRDRSVPRKKGIGGAHNADEFAKAINEEGALIVSSKPHPKVPGVQQVEYRMPALDKTGKPIPGQYKSTIYEKTTYDPSVIPDEVMMQWGKEAATNAARFGELPREFVGVTNDGIPIKVYTDGNGNVITFFVL